MFLSLMKCLWLCDTTHGKGCSENRHSNSTSFRMLWPSRWVHSCQKAAESFQNRFDTIFRFCLKLSELVYAKKGCHVAVWVTQSCSRDFPDTFEVGCTSSDKRMIRKNACTLHTTLYAPQFVYFFLFIIYLFLCSFRIQITKTNR